MTSLVLTPEEQRHLQRYILQAPSGRALCRAQALLRWARGDAVAAIVDCLGISRQTLYNWVQRFQSCPARDLHERLADRPRSGRPPTALGVIDPLLDQVLDRDPRDFGYRSTRWTAPLLQDYLETCHDIAVCTKSVSFALERLRVRWKRARHRLADRPSTWRQAKGGSSAGFRGEAVPSR
jgi:transposase